MRIGILGSGGVGATLGTALVQRGHEVRMGSRSKGSEKAVAWAQAAGSKALLALWIRLMVKLGTPTFNFRVVVGGASTPR